MASQTEVGTPAKPEEAAPTGLAALLRMQTEALHLSAERSGIVRALLRGRASRNGYALLLRNLLPAYQELERGLNRHVHSRGVCGVVWPALFRAKAIEADLNGLTGPRWHHIFPLLPEGEQYVQSIAAAGDGSGARLIAHVYVRYFGDLSGGQIMKPLLMRSLGLDASTLSYYEFEEISDIAAFKARFRSAIDRAAMEIEDVTSVVEEAVAAFKSNIALSEAVYAVNPG